MSSSKHWADIAETTTITGIRILLFAYRIGGPLLFKVCLFPVICFYFLFRDDSRRASKEYLRRVQKKSPQLPTVIWSLSFKHFWQFALIQIDKFAIWTGKISHNNIVMHNFELFERLVQKKQGAIFAVSHLGNIEICLALTSSNPDLKLTMLHHTKHAEKFNHVLNQYTDNSNVQMIQVTNMDAAIAMQLSEKVECGEFIAIATDRVSINNPEATVSCDFLGEPASFPRGPFVLASALVAPMLLLICIKQQGTYHMYFELLSEGNKVARSDRKDFISQTAQKFARRLEYYTCKEPLQWFNFYDFWHKN
jgi:predicted LPLAT superfamily acyltransferase